MAEFQINEPIKTEEAVIEVTISDNNRLAPGRHTFQLTVVDDSGNESEPDRVMVVVLDQERPTAILSAPGQVASGKSFSLDGRRSVDAGGGRITAYVWTYLGATG
jgi:hypothetical protein